MNVRENEEKDDDGEIEQKGKREEMIKEKLNERKEE